MATKTDEPVVETTSDDIEDRRAPAIEGNPVVYEDARRPSRIERLTAQVRSQMHVRELEEADDEEDIVLRAGSGRITIKRENGVQLRTVDHIHPQQYRLYKPAGHGVYVPATNWEICISQGLLVDCPVCNSDCGGAPWGCAKQKPPKFMQCPECGKKFYDSTGSAAVTLSDDPDRIPHPAEKELAAAGALSKYTQHMIWVHPAVATAMGIMEPQRI